MRLLSDVIAATSQCCCGSVGSGALTVCVGTAGVETSCVVIGLGVIEGKPGVITNGSETAMHETIHILMTKMI